MTDQTLPSLDAIQARADAATDGPWDAVIRTYGSDAGDHALAHIPGVLEEEPGGYDVEPYAPLIPADAAFIAHARTDVPVLVAALRAVLDVADQLDRLAARHPDSETGHVETAAAHEIRAAITAHIDTTPKEKP